MTRLQRRGFTFIELLIVFAIICILAAILFPVFSRAREKALQTGCAVHLRNIGTALDVYAADYYGHFPPNDNDLFALHPKYLPDWRALTCPTLRIREEGSEPGFRPYSRRMYPARRADHVCDYLYLSGFCDDDAARDAIAGDNDPKRHNSGANYLYIDGHVRWLEGFEFLDAGETPSAPTGTGPSARPPEPSPAPAPPTGPISQTTAAEAPEDQDIRKLWEDAGNVAMPD